MKNHTRIGRAALAFAFAATAAACGDTAVGPDLGMDLGLNGGAEAGNLETTTGETVLKWAEALQEDMTVTRKIGRWGGILGIDGLVTLTVPPFALNEATELSMTSFAGEDVAFEFGPHGTHFDRPVLIWLDLCRVAGFDTSSVTGAVAAPTTTSKWSWSHTDWTMFGSGASGSTDTKTGDEGGSEEAETAVPAGPCSGNWWESGSFGDGEQRLEIGGMVAVYFTESGPEVETLDIMDVELVFNRYLKFDTDHFSGYALAW